jgi:chaperonin GroES
VALSTRQAARTGSSATRDIARHRDAGTGQKTFPWPKAANIKFPLLTVASIQFQARAYPAIVDGSNLVKGRVLGRDQDGSKRERADRIGQHMTWQLLYRMADWEEDTDKLLLMLPITGCVFRKTYYDPIAGTNRSDMITADDFVVDYWAKSLDRAPRYTHILHRYPYEVRANFAADLWRKVQFSQEPESSDDVEGLIDFYEQHRMIDLDGDGIPEPYVVTTTTEGRLRASCRASQRPTCS